MTSRDYFRGGTAVTPEAVNASLTPSINDAILRHAPPLVPPLLFYSSDKLVQYSTRCLHQCSSYSIRAHHWLEERRTFMERRQTSSELNRWFRSTVKRTLGEDFFEFDPKTRWIESMGKEEKRRPRAWRRGTSLSPSESITRPFYFCARPESRPGVIKLFVSIVPTFHLSSTPILLFPFH